MALIEFLLYHVLRDSMKRSQAYLKCNVGVDVCLILMLIRKVEFITTPAFTVCRTK